MNSALQLFGVFCAVVVVGVVAFLLLRQLHSSLVRFVYFPLARRRWRRRGLEPVRWNCWPEIDPHGGKTESTIVVAECIDRHGQLDVQQLRVWIFGVRGEHRTPAPAGVLEALTRTEGCRKAAGAVG
ncbi:MAG: hypothetical protein JSR82_01230 [Verrucomicrobia bacterium]|nr:hypothetical protein [Verrucomicrobiota bacterium]